MWLIVQMIMSMRTQVQGSGMRLQTSIWIAKTVLRMVSRMRTTDFYVVDSTDDYVYVYTSSYPHVLSSSFDLDSNNRVPRGITYANNRFYVVDSTDDYVYVYTSSGQ